MVQTNVSGPSATRRAITFVLRLLGLAASCWLLSRLVDLSAPVAVLGRLPPIVAIGALGVALARTWLTALRWHLLMPSDAGLSTWRCFRLLMVSQAFGLFLPGVVGGDVARSVMVLRESEQNAAGALVSIAADRVIGLLSIVVLGSLGCLLAPQVNGRWLAFTLFAGAGLLLAGAAWASMVPALQRRVLHMLDRGGRLGAALRPPLVQVFSGLSTYRDRPTLLLTSFALCLPVHLMWFAVVWGAGVVLGMQIDFVAVAAATAIVWVATMVPVSIGGMGVRELGFVVLLAGQGVSEADASALALFQSALLVATGAVALLFVWLPGAMAGPRAAAEASASEPTSRPPQDGD